MTNCILLERAGGHIQKYGTRYSEFWHLEYWDPTRQVIVDCMHNALEGNAQNHFRQILALTKESAQSKPAPTPVFTYKFAKVDIEESPLPDNLTLKEAKQVKQIHSLLTAPFDGVDDTGAIVDQTLFDDSVTRLHHHLSGKNTKLLKFIYGDIKLLPHKPNIQLAIPLSNIKYFKNDWIECLMEWVCMDFPIILPYIDVIS